MNGFTSLVLQIRLPGDRIPMETWVPQGLLRSALWIKTCWGVKEIDWVEETLNFNAVRTWALSYPGGGQKWPTLSQVAVPMYPTIISHWVHSAPGSGQDHGPHKSQRGTLWRASAATTPGSGGNDCYVGGHSHPLFVTCSLISFPNLSRLLEDFWTGENQAKLVHFSYPSPPPPKDPRITF